MEYRIPPGTEAVEKLEDFIVVNRLAPNTRIPSERDLCEMWGVSRTTLRQAVDTLVGRGVLYRINGAGATYIQYLWVRQQGNIPEKVIYIPTEANLPILEAKK